INLNNTTLTISNLRYYDMFKFININELFNKIQEFITTNKFTPEEFKDFANVTDNNAIKTLISNNLLISSTETLPIKNIIDVSVNDNYDLEVSLNKDYVKYDMQQDNNVVLNNDILTFSNFVYYSTINISNLNSVFDYIQEIITNNQFTPNELIEYIKTNLNELKKELSSILLISETASIDENEITNIAISNSSKFEITLNSLNKKYTIDEYENATLNNTTISFSNLQFYTSIKFSNLSSVRSAIQDIITSKSYTQSEFSTYVSNNKTSLRDTISSRLSKTINGPGSWSISQISNVEYNGGNVRITFNPPANYKYLFESYSYASVSNNVLTITNFSYYSPTSSSYFTWNGSQITGLSSSGSNLTSITIPTNCTSIAKYAFRNNKNIRTVVIPGSVNSIGVGSFEFCTNLSSLTLKEGINEILGWAFRDCINLTSITIPNSITYIREYSFMGCYRLETLNINSSSSKLRLIEQWAFQSCENLYSITIPQSCEDIHYAAFSDNDNTRYIYIYANRITIRDYAFGNLSKLESVYFYQTNPDNLNLINTAFKNCRSGNLFVKNNSMWNKITSVKLVNYKPTLHIF
ncbi:MAG: leucine-rich repeat domain-containing protein, partial [Ureaplasma sp.]|nr:leucine-rich repeat domain-containing protein [Ureaplasma sp.]